MVLICQTCKCEEFLRTDTGSLVCKLCGTQAHQGYEEEMEIEQDNLTRHGKRIRRYKTRGSSKESKAGSGTVSPILYFRAWQWILREQLGQLRNVYTSADALDAVVEHIWFMCVSHFL